MERLYIEGADWQKLVIELSETRIEEEVDSREVIESFEEPTQAEPDFENTSLYSLRPFLHVKIFQLTEEIDLECDLPSGLQVIFRKPNHEKSMDLFIIRNTSKPKWAYSDQFTGSEFHLFIIYFDVNTKLLFINSSYKNDLVYEAIANSYSQTVPHSLSLDKVDKVLVDLENFDFFNIGMRSNLLKNNVESYRILTGSSTQKKINRMDGRYFNRGHLFGRADEGDNKVTIGYSSSSKVWSNRYEGISRLLFWCKQLAQKISSEKEVNTFSSLDFLSTGKSVNKIPKGVIALGWNVEIYKKPPNVEYTVDETTHQNEQLLDFSLLIDKENSDDNNIKFSVYNERINCSLTFSLESEEYFTAVENYENVKIHRGKTEFTLVEYLNNFPLNLYFADFSSLCGSQYYESDSTDIEPFDTENQMMVVDWETEKVDIRREKGDIVDGKTSIHGYLKHWLPQTDSQIVFLDDSAGEMADFITFKETEDEILISFYHCKKAHGVGVRVEDAYEVCGQVLKSIIWVNNSEIYNQIVHRQKNTINSTFLKGEKTELRQLLNKAKTTPTFFEIIIVQPGFIQSSLPEGIGHILAGANDYIIRGLCNPLKIMCRK